MKQIRLFLILVFFSQFSFSQDCTLQKSLSIDETICLGQSANIQLLSSEVGVSYQLRNDFDDSVIGLPIIGDGNTIVFTVNPLSTTVYNVLSYTDSPACATEMIDLVTITVTPAMTLALSSANATQTVCINTAISGISYSVGNATNALASGLPTGVVGNYNSGIFTITGTPTVSGSFPYTVTTSGGCLPAVVLGGTITVAPTTVGGAVTVSAVGVTPVVTSTTICHSGSGFLYLSGHVGNVLRWESSTTGGSTWTSIANTFPSHFYVNLVQTTIFRAVIQNTSQCNIVYSNISIINVIPNIKPNPVTATPAVICEGQSSVLTSQSGFATSGNIASGGSFQYANPAGWGVDGQFSGNYLASGNSNTNENTFALSANSNGTYSGINVGSTGKFAIVHGDLWGAPNNGTSFMESPVFNTFGLETATLNFVHAYRLYPGASIKVDLSLDGGTNYTVSLYSQTGSSSPYIQQTPFNNFTTAMSLNLNNYIGQPNLRIRFTYFSNNTASLWAVDNIIIPQTPAGTLTTQWVDIVTNTVISNASTVTVSPPTTTTYAVTSFLNGCVSFGSAGTSYVTVTVNPRPTATIGPNQTICNSSPATFSVNLTGTPPWSITYTDGTTPVTVNNILSSTYIFNTPSLNVNKTYTITSASDSNGCSALATDITNNANITVLNGSPGVWTGLFTSDWFDCLNWMGGVPNSSVDAVIPSGSPRMPVIDQATLKAIALGGVASARDILITGGASLTMQNNSSLNVRRDWKNNGVFNAGNGTVVFDGNASNQQHLINDGIKLSEEFYNLNLNVSGTAKGINLPNDFNLTVANHLILQNGDLRLTGEAQLIQRGDTENPLIGTGRLFRDQQGTKSAFHYNFWSSPVSIDNDNYNLVSVLRDGTNVTTDPFLEKIISFSDDAYYSDGPLTNPLRISNRWINKYTLNTTGYYGWQRNGSTGNLKVGEGYSMKGVTGTAALTELQNYVFVGKPNNGIISVDVSANQDFLLGNPYASAIDADEFIKDNIKDNGGRATTNKFNGILYFYDNFGGTSHFLSNYVAGYATYSLMGFAPAISNDPISANTGQISTKIPKRYVPVGQGFFISTYSDPSLIANNPNLNPIVGGSIVFKNSQRAFERESSGNSIFFRTSNQVNENGDKNINDKRPKITLMFKSHSGIYRQLLLGADQMTTDGYDIGYDAPMIDVKESDIYWNINQGKFIINAISNFNDESSVPLVIKSEKFGENEIVISKLENIEDSKEIYLFDKLTGRFHNLRDSEFKIALDKGEYVNRFSIRFSKETLSNDENTLNSNISIYYAVGDKNLNILNNSSSNLKEIQVFNLLGQRVLRSLLDNVYQSSIKIPVNKLSDATYVVKVITDNGVVTKKVIIN